MPDPNFKKEQGYVLVVVIFILLLLTVTVVSLNRRAGLQAKIAANQVRTVQTRFGQLAAIEKTAWQLLRDPDWRTDEAGEDFTFNGIVYNRKILDSTANCPPDAILISVTAPGASRPITAGLRIRYAYQETVYIADTDNHKIKMVDPANERIYTVPTPGIVLNKPRGVAVDASGNLYIADTENHRIVKLDISAYISPGQFTVASEVLEAGFLSKPHGVFFQNGSTPRLYIADTDNYRIRQMDSDGAVSTLHAGFLSKPRGGALDCPGNIYIADHDNDRVKQVDTSGERSILPTGPIEHPQDVAADDRGNIYVADHDNYRVIRVSPRGAVTTVAGFSDKPHGVAVGASGSVYMSDTHNHCVHKLDTAGVLRPFAGMCGNGGETGDNSLAVNTKLNMPNSIAVYSQVTSTVTGLEWISEIY